MHLVADLEGWKEAQARGLPFYRTACGSAAPRKKLVTDPAAVKCPGCEAAVQQMYAQMAAQAEEEAQAAQSVDPEAPAFEFEDAEVDFGDDEDDLAVDLSMFGSPELHDLSDEDVLSDDGAEAEVEVIEEANGMISMVSEMVAPLLEGVDVSEDWERWTLSPESDPDGVLTGEGTTDVRQCITEGERELLAGLANLSGMIGLTDLSAGLISIIHRQAVIIDALADG